MRTRAAIVVVLTAASACFFPIAQAGAGGACMGGIPGEGFTDAEGTKVVMVEACFSPTVIRVAAGDTVTFTNEDKMVHAVGGAVGSFGDAHPLRPGIDVAGGIPQVSSGDRSGDLRI